MKSIVWIASAAFAFTALGACSGIAIMDGKEYAETVDVETPSLDALADGDYSGEYTIAVPAGSMAMMRRYEVTVTVATVSGEKRISGVTIDYPEDFPEDTFEETMSARVLAAQSLDVDAFSGATFSSKAFLKAVEDALD